MSLAQAGNHFQEVSEIIVQKDYNYKILTVDSTLRFGGE